MLVSNTQKEISKILDRITESKKVQKHFLSLEKQLKDAYKHLDKLQRVLTKEYKDVLALEQLNMKSLFHKVLGSKEEQIEKERQEYLQASLQYNDYKKSVELMEFERDVLKKKLSDTKDLEKKLATLKKQREKEILQSNTIEGKALMRIANKIDKLVKFKRELNEALDSGAKCEQHLDRLVHYLSKAGDWGQWDMVGRGSMSTIHKMSAIDKAREASYYAKHHLNKFQHDLYDIGGKNFRLDVNIGSFNNFSDIFFDNLISDWIIQQKIKNALHNVSSVKDTVLRLMQGIQSQLSNTQKELAILQKERNNIILER